MTKVYHQGSGDVLEGHNLYICWEGAITRGFRVNTWTGASPNLFLQDCAQQNMHIWRTVGIIVAIDASCQDCVSIFLQSSVNDSISGQLWPTDRVICSSRTWFEHREPPKTFLRYTVSWRCIRLWATQYTRTQCRPVEVTCNIQTTFHLHHELHVCYRFLSHLSHPYHVRPWALHIYKTPYIYIYYNVKCTSHGTTQSSRDSFHKNVGTVEVKCHTRCCLCMFL